jgi:hypothetical protein
MQARYFQIICCKRSVFDGYAAESTSYLGLQTSGEFITCPTVKNNSIGGPVYPIKFVIKFGNLNTRAA